MQSLIGPEMMSGVVEMVVYFFTALTTMLSFVLTARA